MTDNGNKKRNIVLGTKSTTLSVQTFMNDQKNRSSHLEAFFEKGVLIKFTFATGQHLCWGL